MTESMILPQYGRGALSSVLPAIAAALGIGHADTLGLPSAERWVVLLVDGMGWYNLQASPHHAPFLGSLATRADTLTSTAPSTTVSALTSLGTGLEPGRHGIAGFSWRMPETGSLFFPLAWNSTLRGDQCQPNPTWLERFAEAGITTTTVSAQRFADSGLTNAALRGGQFCGLADEDDEDARVEQVLQASDVGPSVVYTYERRLDHIGHGSGWLSDTWRAQLLEIDAFAERLRDELDDDVALVITADHGMIDVPWSDRLMLDDEPDLLAGTAMVAGEPRFRQVYVGSDSADVIARRWCDRLGDTAWVRTREEAIDEGWLGPVADAMAARFGDVLCAMRQHYAIMTRALPGELGMVGMHGSLTAQEMVIPLLVA